MIVEELLKLPPWIDYEGINFQLQLINDGGKEIRLVYAIDYVDISSPHKLAIEVHGCWQNKFADPVDPPYQGFLLLYENINSDVDLCWAIRDCWIKLQQWELLKV